MNNIEKDRKKINTANILWEINITVRNVIVNIYFQ